MHTLIRAHGAVAYREALFADKTSYAAMEATLPKGSKAEARLDGKGRPYPVMLPHSVIDRPKALRGPELERRHE